MAKFNIDVLGDKDLSAFLKEFPDTLERKILVKVFRKAGKFLLAITRPNIKALLDGPHPGFWKNRVSVRPFKRKRGRVGINVSAGTRADLALYAAQPTFSQRRPHGGTINALRVQKRFSLTKYYYPAHAEFGHRTPSGGHVPPHPYMGAVLRSNREAVIATVRNELYAEIEREYNKQAARALVP